MGTIEQGVKNEVENCLSVKAGEIVVVITSDVLQHGKMGSFLGVRGCYGFLVKSKSDNGPISIWSEQFHRNGRN